VAIAEKRGRQKRRGMTKRIGSRFKASPKPKVPKPTLKRRQSAADLAAVRDRQEQEAQLREEVGGRRRRK
jgi:hypothetical protein